MSKNPPWDEEKLKGFLKENSRYSSQKRNKINPIEPQYKTIDEAVKNHYSQIGEVLAEELEQKMKFRKFAVCFMLAFVAIHVIIAFSFLFYVVHARTQTGNDVVSDSFMLTFLISPLVNFLASLGIIFKYLFSQTSETYTYLKSFIHFDD